MAKIVIPGAWQCETRIEPARRLTGPLVTVAHGSFCTTRQRNHTPRGERNRRGTVTPRPIPIR